ncbi:hypothetical protein [Acinetobacter sp. DSM 11652]|uniref:hypothetical protein n=1 Tax=Acinetobacter sp. DSM 11652 TaxID=346222 RepID=UPI0008D30F0D|nr:hypothetical protein [Acinetobacter sp. DSM 11652]SEL29003.1 hypothetical protein SAMN05216500_101305 [Acinetobacter sp. DSM 11652]
MKKLMTLASVATTTILLSACASTPTETLAIQKPNNQYEVSGLGKTQVLAKNNAISAANKTCGKNSAPVLIDEKTEYNGALKGVVDEQTGKLITAASSVLGSVIGTKNTIEKDTDYETTITFSCNSTR